MDRKEVEDAVLMVIHRITLAEQRICTVEYEDAVRHEGELLARSAVQGLVNKATADVRRTRAVLDGANRRLAAVNEVMAAAIKRMDK